ncbi:MAG: LON peptidase substrate-binding domain-containing protein [Thaumarchaeota archaeon]|nr:LON peptidase substrate-binding domain-containing protein [Nitrososphaerota archaeon]
MNVQKAALHDGLDAKVGKRPIVGDASSNEYEAPALLAEDEVIFPHSEATITARDQRNTAALLQAAMERQLIVLVPTSNPRDVPGAIGTLVHVRKTATINGRVNAIVKGLWRVRTEKVLDGTEYSRVTFTKAEEIDDAPASSSEIMKAVHNQIDEFAKLIPGIPPEIIEALRKAETPGKLADLCAYSPSFSSAERLDLLNTLGAEERLQKISKHFERQLADLREAAKIKTISECDTCSELADRALESEPFRRGEIAVEFLNHVAQKHTAELLGVLAEKYGPAFMRRRALK